MISIVHIFKGKIPPPFYLDEQPVEKLTAYLFYQGSNDNPYELLANRSKAFAGPKIDGAGLTFDDEEADATPIEEMNKLIAKNYKNRELIFPLLGGEEMLNHPTHQHRRYVINFEDRTEEEARQWMDLMKIIEEKVKPKRLSGRLVNYPWWHFERFGRELKQAVASLERVLMHPFTSKHLAFAFVPSTTIIPTPHCVIAISTFNIFCVLQSRLHENWIRFFGSPMEDRLRYTPSDCFQTFPFPENWETDDNLEAIGKRYYEFRAELMVRNNEGLTQTYNRFHDPNEFDPDILQLRQLHEEMDRAVLVAYGWSDIQPQCEFLLDYEDKEEDEEESAKRQRKKPYRYRWNEATHDEVLARLLDLNQKRYEQEILGGKQAEKKGKSKGMKAKKNGHSDTPTLPGLEA